MGNRLRVITGFFEWDPEKQRINIKKHGCGFNVASQAFADPHRIIAIDEDHSEDEPRYFCIGRAKHGQIVTVRFTLRENCIRIIGAGFWRKGRTLYEKEETKRNR